jgi:hypothetical protein
VTFSLVHTLETVSGGDMRMRGDENLKKAADFTQNVVSQDCLILHGKHVRKLFNVRTNDIRSKLNSLA